MSIDYSMETSPWTFDFMVDDTQYRMGVIGGCPAVGVYRAGWQPYFLDKQRPIAWGHIQAEGELAFPGRTFALGNEFDESDAMYAYLRKILMLISRQLAEDHPFANDTIDEVPVSDWITRVGNITHHIKVNGSTLTV